MQSESNVDNTTSWNWGVKAPFCDSILWFWLSFWYCFFCHLSLVLIPCLASFCLTGTCSMFTHKVWTSAVVRAQWGTLQWRFSSWQQRTPVKLCRWVTQSRIISDVTEMFWGKWNPSYKAQLEAVKQYIMMSSWKSELLQRAMFLEQRGKNHLMSFSVLL